MAVLITVVLTNILQPGVGLTFDKNSLAKNQGVLEINKNVEAAKNKPWYQYFIELIPQNPVASAARAFCGEIIALMFFALTFGYALSMTVEDEDNPLIKALDTIFNASLKIVEWAMLAPYGIFAIAFNTTYRLGAGFLQNVAYFAGVVVLGLLIQQFVVYGTCLKIFAITNPWEFFKGCKEVYVYTLSTASSNATLPVALETEEKEQNCRVKSPVSFLLAARLPTRTAPRCGVPRSIDR